MKKVAYFQPFPSFLPNALSIGRASPARFWLLIVFVNAVAINRWVGNPAQTVALAYKMHEGSRAEGPHNPLNCYLENRPMRSMYLCGSLAIVLLAGGEVRADILVFSNLGQGDSWDHNDAWIIGQGGASGPVDVAFAFTPTTTTDLSTVELPLGIFSGTNDLEVQVRSASNGLPGTVLETFDFQNLGRPFTNHPLSVGQSVLHPLLTAGQQYFVVVLPGAADTSGAWNANLINPFGNTYFSYDGGQTWIVNQFGGGPAGAFAVTGDVVPSVPEPGSFVLLSTGTLMMLGCASRLRRRVS